MVGKSDPAQNKWQRTSTVNESYTCSSLEKNFNCFKTNQNMGRKIYAKYYILQINIQVLLVN